MIGPFNGEYRFLSNFYPVFITVEEASGILITYPSVEHTYQAMKTLDTGQRLVICKLKTPGEAKRAGRNVTLREDWEQVKFDVMLDLLRLKFKQADLRDRLVATIGQELIEINNWSDTYWGVCNGVGTNHLGRLLMVVRLEVFKERNQGKG